MENPEKSLKISQKSLEIAKKNPEKSLKILEKSLKIDKIPKNLQKNSKR